MTLTVLQIIPHLGAGGAEQACVDMVAGLVARGDRALVVSAGGVRVAEVEKAGGRHILAPVASKNPVRILMNARWLARLIVAENVTVIHARSRAPAWSAWIAARAACCAFVTTFHAVYKFSSKLKKNYNRVMAQADRVIAISAYVDRHIAEAYGVPAARRRLIYRGIDTARFDPAAVTEERRAALRSAWGITPETRVILLPARLSPIKGHRLVLEALTQMPPACQDAVCVIVGDDQGRVAYRQSLETFIRTHGLGARVRLVTHCADMPAAYSLASVVVMPSGVPEGFGRVPVEAAALGVPVIASALGATVETVDEGVTGWLLPPEAPALWAEAMSKALSLTPDQRSALASAAQHKVRSAFTKEKMVADTLAVYDEVAQNLPSKRKPAFPHLSKAAL